MTQARLFKSNQSQAVRLPKAAAFPVHVKQVDVIKQGQALLLVPSQSSWETFFSGPAIDADFLGDRAQPAPQDRDWS
jgi:antitoxin VapB